jgi:hypothetical protein
MPLVKQEAIDREYIAAHPARKLPQDLTRRGIREPGSDVKDIATT